MVKMRQRTPHCPRRRSWRRRRCIPFLLVSKASGAERDRGIGDIAVSSAELTGRAEDSAGLNVPRASQRSARRKYPPYRQAPGTPALIRATR